MPEAQRERTPIPTLCWVRKPDSDSRCCRTAGHAGDHHHYYGGGQWKQQPGDAQES